MSSNKVLLNINEAENIFTYLNAMYETLKTLNTTPEDRAPLIRDMVKLKIAINTAKGLDES